MTQSAVEKQQGLASKLKQEISTINSSAEKQVQLEQEKAEAEAAEKALVQKFLDAERQKVSLLLFVTVSKSSDDRLSLAISSNISNETTLFPQNQKCFW